MADAIKVDPDTKRTIPVITKPDLIDSGAENSVLDLLLGKKKDFTMGFHMVKCRGQKAINEEQTIVQSQIDEEQFFKQKNPWRAVEDRSQLGIKHLRNKLAAIQVQMCDLSIPSIIIEIQKKKQDAISQLDVIGIDLFTDSLRRNAFNKFLQDSLKFIELSLDGSGQFQLDNGYKWRANIQLAFKTFGNQILSQNIANIGKIQPGAKVLYQHTNLKQYKAIIDQLNDNGKAYAKPINSQDNDIFYSTEYGEIIENKNLPIENFSHDNTWLLQIMDKNKNKDLPCFFNEKIFNNIFSDMIEEQCAPLCKELLDQIQNQCQNLVNEAFNRNFPVHFPQLLLFIQEKTNQLLIKVYDNAKNNIKQEILMEQNPFTNNHYLFENINKKRLKGIKELIIQQLKATNDINALEISINAIFDLNEKKSIEEHIADEMQLILESYGKVATKRIIDKIPMVIENIIFNNLIENISEDIKLTDIQLSQFMQESFITKQKRKILNQQLKSMQTAEEDFIKFKMRDFD